MTFAPADVIKRYLELREEDKEITKREKAAALERQNVLEAMENFFLLTMQQRGEVQIKTEFGTAFQSPQLRVRMADRLALVEHVKRTGEFDLFTNSVSKEAVTAYVEAHQAPPPGVEITRFISCNVRKA